MSSTKPTSRNLQHLVVVLLFVGYGLALPIVVGFSQDRPPQLSTARVPTRQPDLVEFISLDPRCGSISATLRPTIWSVARFMMRPERFCNVPRLRRWCGLTSH